jgi:hypothetical protein
MRDINFFLKFMSHFLINECGMPVGGLKPWVTETLGITERLMLKEGESDDEFVSRILYSMNAEKESIKLVSLAKIVVAALHLEELEEKSGHFLLKKCRKIHRNHHQTSYPIDKVIRNYVPGFNAQEDAADYMVLALTAANDSNSLLRIKEERKHSADARFISICNRLPMELVSYISGAVVGVNNYICTSNQINKAAKDLREQLREEDKQKRIDDIFEGV